jgi:alpha-1,3-rhamnosyl/mannosyltransferase
MPLLEAMSMACPVLCSNTSSLPEVAGDAAKIIDPLKPNELIEGLNELLYNEEVRNELIKRGINRAKQFTWTRCAEETHAVYKKVLKKP